MYTFYNIVFYKPVKLIKVPMSPMIWMFLGFPSCSLYIFQQVYEQLYDTLDIVGGPEVRAQATAKVMTTNI